MNYALTIEFWEVSSGNSPVVDRIESLPIKAKEKVYWVIKLLRKRGTALMYTKFMTKLEGFDLYELRVLFQGIWYRILFIIKNSIACLLHMFEKEGNRTPIREIKKALVRAELYLATA